MPYDSNLDQKLFSEAFENDACRISVSVYSYNNGAKKLQISRENKTEDGEYRFTKLGRLTREEVEGIVPHIQEAISKLD